MMSPIQKVRAHIAMQIPRTLVGNISEQRIFGIGPKPITKVQKYTTTLTVEITACMTSPMLITLPRTSTISDDNKTGNVASKSHLENKQTVKLLLDGKSEELKMHASKRFRYSHIYSSLNFNMVKVQVLIEQKS